MMDRPVKGVSQTNYDDLRKQIAERNKHEKAGRQAVATLNAELASAFVEQHADWF